MNNYYTALCCDNFGGWKKYRNISIFKIDQFEKFAKQIGVRYINYYDKQTKKYVKRVYL